MRCRCQVISFNKSTAGVGDVSSEDRLYICGDGGPMENLSSSCSILL